MSVLLHRCRTCQHPADWHDGRNRGYTSCSCCNAGSADPDPEPVVQPTFASPSGGPEPLLRPGTARNEGTMHATRTCACQRCQAVYERLDPVRLSEVGRLT
ncbi:hypothetical protein VV02_17890 [Luteipulveratus mongoliensis]|uniref:Uncharacterized protein n=1 Tax=Luteipulveratus mongoliensis TaxID=571913 RepID=A0A0K1JKQ5_9MICO|nr:hypothetical protein VV02_17890 [Luteipulveratus mongoliensis]